ATGYNGAPRNMRDCLENGCIREKMGVPSGQRHELCRGLHAEQNVIVQAAVHGVSIKGAHIYCTHQPCLICAKLLINCGVAVVYYDAPYPDEMSENMFAEANIPLVAVDSLAPAGTGESRHDA
ncbi:cytidine deaminase, partial [Desulfovibrio sp. OttesenSCG-928-M14]|nr:cytidine deaminase [Desulfovibrio sp. OttesenSCG-928-M14]